MNRLRALDSATIVGEALGMTPAVLAELREIYLGAATGLPMQTRIALWLGPGSLSELTVNRWGERQVEYLNRH